MVELKRPKGAIFTITAVISTTSGLVATCTIQNLNAASTDHLKFWNATTSLWQTLTVSNALLDVVGNPGVYTLNVPHSLMSNIPDDLYCVRVTESTTSYADTTFYRFGDLSDQQIASIANYLVPARKEVLRITDTHIRISGFSATTGGVELSRLDIVHDTSGVQLEEIQTNTTSQI